jgi:uncharacterized membrane protein YccC
MAARALARYAAGQQDPYSAPLAALLGVSPTVARSLREGLQYVAGFVLGAVLAIPAALVLGPSIAGIAVVVLAGVVIGSWRRLGGQSTQVTFTALFVLLIGGYQPLHYLTPPADRRGHRGGHRTRGQCPGVPAAAATPSRACGPAMGR